MTHTRSTATIREQLDVRSRSVVSGHPVSVSVAVDAGKGKAGNNAFRFSEEGFQAGLSKSGEPAMCHRNRKNRTERRDGQVRTYRPDCMCWVCDTCRPKLQAKWISHGSACLRECGKPIVLVQVALDDFARFARKLNRMGAKYIRVRANGRYEVFVATNKPEQLCGMRVEASVAVEFFSKLVKKIVSSAGGNPISTCRKWALPSRERSTWELIAEGPTPEQIRKAVEVAECGKAIKCLDRTINGLTVTICSGPILAIDGLCELIASLECGNHSMKAKSQVKKNTSTANELAIDWGYEPDESVIPYTVAAVT